MIERTGEPLKAIIVMASFGVGVEATVDGFLKPCDPDREINLLIGDGEGFDIDAFAVGFPLLSIDGITIIIVDISAWAPVLGSAT